MLSSANSQFIPTCFQVAAPFVDTTVDERGEKLADQVPVGTVDLDAVEASFSCPAGGLALSLDQESDLVGRHLARGGRLKKGVLSDREQIRVVGPRESDLSNSNYAGACFHHHPVPVKKTRKLFTPHSFSDSSVSSSGISVHVLCRMASNSSPVQPITSRRNVPESKTFTWRRNSTVVAS